MNVFIAKCVVFARRLAHSAISVGGYIPGVIPKVLTCTAIGVAVGAVVELVDRGFRDFVSQLAAERIQKAHAPVEHGTDTRRMNGLGFWLKRAAINVRDTVLTFPRTLWNLVLFPAKVLVLAGLGVRIGVDLLLRREVAENTWPRRSYAWLRNHTLARITTPGEQYLAEMNDLLATANGATQTKTEDAETTVTRPRITLVKTENVAESREDGSESTGSTEGDRSYPQGDNEAHRAKQQMLIDILDQNCERKDILSRGDHFFMGRHMRSLCHSLFDENFDEEDVRRACVTWMGLNRKAAHKFTRGWNAATRWADGRRVV